MNNLDVYAEEGVLANVLDDPESLVDVLEIINVDDFLEPRNAQIFDAFIELHQRGVKIRVTTVASALRDNGLLDKVGGTPYLTSLVNPTAPYHADGDAVVFANILKDESARRKMKAIAQDIVRMSATDSGSLADEVVAYAQDALQNIQIKNAARTAEMVSSLVDDAVLAIHERSKNESGIQGIPSGFIDLDRKTTGWHPGQFVVIAARPGVGKSTLALDFVRAASCAHKYTSMFFSLEMSREDIMQRLLAAEGGINLNNIRDGKLSPEEWAKVDETATALQSKHIRIDDTPSMNIDHIRAACTRQSNQPEGLDLIVVDYLQLMSSGRRVESRQQEVAEFSRSLKLIAKEFGIPVIALSQLNRDSEKRGSEAPRMSDIRESGAIEQDADMIMFLHRESKDGGVTDQTVLTLEKNRQGESGVRVPLLARLDIAQFVSGAGQFRAPEELISNPEEYNIPPDDSDSIVDIEYSPPVDTSVTENTQAAPAPAWGPPPTTDTTEVAAEEAPVTPAFPADGNPSPNKPSEPVMAVNEASGRNQEPKSTEPSSIATAW